MNKNIDYYEDEIEEKEQIVQGAMERADEIDELLANKPKIGTVEWKRRVNGLIERYNEDFGKVYNKIR